MLTVIEYNASEFSKEHNLLVVDTQMVLLQTKSISIHHHAMPQIPHNSMLLLLLLLFAGGDLCDSEDQTHRQSQSRRPLLQRRSTESSGPR